MAKKIIIFGCYTISISNHNKNLYNRYLLYYSYTEYFKDQFFANEGGTVGQGNIGLTDIKDLEIPLPPLAEQKTHRRTVRFPQRKNKSLAGYIRENSV